MITRKETNTQQTTLTKKITWKSPSNIAIVKYWGKHGEQLPANPSISLTLSNACTETSVEYGEGNGKLEFYFEGVKNDAFGRRVKDVIHRLITELPELGSLDMKIDSSNSFPHSAGIASSASAMSALALCMSSVAAEVSGNVSQMTDISRVSHYARLGSGSASRSVAGPVMLWGETPHLEGSSDQYALSVPNVDPVFSTYCDAILIVSGEEKQVKSSAGHALMNGHPYAEKRFEIARSRVGELLDILDSGDVHAFGRMAEQEAMDLHAMMMTSTPPYVLMRPGTLAIIETLRDFRDKTGQPVYMTLDAGPNVHLLYPEAIAPTVTQWIDSKLKKYCVGGKVLFDRVGKGPELISI